MDRQWRTRIITSVYPGIERGWRGKGGLTRIKNLRKSASFAKSAFPAWRALSVAVFCLIALWLASPTTVLAQSPAPDSPCAGCHGDNEHSLPLPSGELLPLDVDLAALVASAHGSGTAEPINCVDCHRNDTNYRYPHLPNPAMTLEEYRAQVTESCQSCHTPLEQHNPGHLNAVDNPNLPGCVDCHGQGHSVTPADTLAADPVATCQSCHQTYDDPKVGEVHAELAANLGSEQSCQTCHSDKPIYPADVRCRNCHLLLNGGIDLASGESVSLHVDPATIAGSVHGSSMVEHRYSPLRCTSCHRDEERYAFPHTPLTVEDARGLTLEMDDLCQECHTEIAALDHDGVHEVARERGELAAASCADCHGSHNIQSPNEPREHISETCGQCHSTINEQYAGSVHGAALLGEHNPDVPVCTDCHGVHNMPPPQTAQFRVESPNLCASCHADETLMAKYDISTAVFDTYVADFHGTTVQLFEKQTPWQETNKAVCYDCHGVHNILPANDEHSQVIKENLVVTCQQCHPDANANFPASWTSHFEPSPEHNPLVYYINLFYQILIPAVVGGFALLIGSDVYRRTGDSWRRRRAAKPAKDERAEEGTDE